MFQYNNVSRVYTFIFVLILSPQFITAQEFSEDLVAIEVAPSSFFEGSPENFIELKGKAVFTAGALSKKLWISDGTEDGTYSITFPEWQNINLRQNKLAKYAVVLNDELYFLVESSSSLELWKTDGTQDGTTKVVSEVTLNISAFRSITAFGDRIAFIAYSSEDGFDRLFLVNSNGDGAEKVEEIERIYNGGIPPRMAVLNDELYTVESSGPDRNIVRIKQNGTVEHVWQMPENSEEDFRSIYALTVAGDNLFFIGNDGYGFALWVYNDGTANRLFHPHEDEQEQMNVHNLTAVGDKVYFFSQPWDDENDQFHIKSFLYVSDGTSAGTYQLWNSNLGDGHDSHNASNLPTIAAGDRFLFVAPHSSITENAWWSVEGSSSSFEALIANGNYITHTFSNSDPVVYENEAWITTGGNLIKTNGTNAGTEIIGPDEVRFISNQRIINGLPWFNARTQLIGDNSLWRVINPAEDIPLQATLLYPKDDQDTVSVVPEITWSEVNYADNYQLQISRDLDFDELEIDINAIEQNSYQLTDSLEHKNPYYVRVRAINEYGSGKWSAYHRFITAEKTPTVVSLSSPSNNMEGVPTSRSFYWEESELAESYLLQVSDHENFSDLYIDTVVTAARSLNNRTFKLGTKYFWRVKAVNNGGESEWSEVWNFTTTTDPATKITLLAPASSSDTVNTTPSFYWNKADEAEKYQLLLSLNPQFNEILLDSTVSDTLLVLDEVLDHNTTYFWKVRAILDKQIGAWSNYRHFKTVYEPVRIVSLLVPENNGDEVNTTPVFSWKGLDSVDSYRIQIAKDNNFTEVMVDSFSISDITFTPDIILDGQTQYWWRVKTSDGINSDWSEHWTFTTFITTDTEDENFIPTKFALDQNYPNPFNPSTNIRYHIPKTTQVSLIVYDMLGKEISTLVDGRVSAGIHTITFDASGLSSGMYIYRLEANGKVKTKNLILIK